VSQLSTSRSQHFSLSGRRSLERVDSASSLGSWKTISRTNSASGGPGGGAIGGAAGRGGGGGTISRSDSLSSNNGNGSGSSYGFGHPIERKFVKYVLTYTLSSSPLPDPSLSSPFPPLFLSLLSLPRQQKSALKKSRAETQRWLTAFQSNLSESFQAVAGPEAMDLKHFFMELDENEEKYDLSPQLPSLFFLLLSLYSPYPAYAPVAHYPLHLCLSPSPSPSLSPHLPLL
jgi:hypothetical protein